MKIQSLLIEVLLLYNERTESLQTIALSKKCLILMKNITKNVVIIFEYLTIQKLFICCENFSIRRRD